MKRRKAKKKPANGGQGMSGQDIQDRKAFEQGFCH
jgi:hypothetical protein